MGSLEAVLCVLASCLMTVGAEFTDEMQSFDPMCLEEGSFNCLDGKCVPQSKYCDGYIDCDDGSDENFCAHHLPDEQLCNATHQYMCKDHKRCIHNTWVCNNEADCEDGSDEVNCTAPSIPNKNSTCKGFVCDRGRCISNLWTCDGTYDCDDRTDEDIEKTCRHALLPHMVNDGFGCREFTGVGPRSYKCLDMSFCVSEEQMCDGMKDCKDGSDEGSFCDKWHTMCSNFTCGGNNTICSREREGPVCVCLVSYSLKQYNYTTHQCEDVNDCLQDRPQCSHSCENKDGYFVCQCEPGYIKDQLGYLCYAPDPEATLFFSTQNDISYLKIKSKQQVTVATGIKEGHGVSFDGSHLYWVETAQGHQSIVRAQLDNIQESKEVLVGLGLEDPGDIAVDWLGGNIYFSDTERGIISVCRSDGSVCTTVHTETRHPRFVTLDVRQGTMYWADWHNRAVIMRSRMDGSHAETLVDSLRRFATGLAADIPNKRLYFVDGTIKVVRVDDKTVYSLFEEPFHHPYAIAVFENTVYWSDWTSNTLQRTDKLHSSSEKRSVVLFLDNPIFDMHIYHPIMMNRSSNPCEYASCSHLCLITSNTTHICACPDGMEVVDNVSCRHTEGYRPQYLVVGGGASFTRIQYNTLGNPETHGTHFDIGRVQAMAYDNVRDDLYIYDGQRKSINYISMSEFTLGLTHLFLYSGLENVVDMGYDYVTDSLYILDSGRRVLEVVSLKTKQRALVHHFTDEEIPISFCIMSDYGRMLVAVLESEQSNEIHVDSIGLHGEDRQNLLLNNLMGPYVRLRYAQDMDIVYVSDEGNGIIDFIHPGGTGRENFRELSTTIVSLAVTDTYVFWTDRRTSKLFWSDVHEVAHKIRRIELSIFPNNTQLHILGTTLPPSTDSPLNKHPCLTRNPCSDVCVQLPHPTPHQAPTNFTMGYKCLCPPGFLLADGKCTKVSNCKEDEFHCHKTNECFLKQRKCDGKKDCPRGEDEEGCAVSVQTTTEVSRCPFGEILCNDVCISQNEVCKMDSAQHKNVSTCKSWEFQCMHDKICIERSLACDGHADCPDGTDENPAACDNMSCFETEFRCAMESCIPVNWRCDGSEDCPDGSDEIGCENKKCSPGHFRCHNGACIELAKRCNHELDCLDHSDEDDCERPDIPDILEEKPKCQHWEYTCERDTSICLPRTVRCNKKIDCPGGTDESGCDFRCAPHGLFECKQEMTCVTRGRLCDGKNDCLDGSDETPDVCHRVNKSSRLYPTSPYPPAQCHNGYLCDNGQCIEWHEVCDGTPNCFDGSDENGLCAVGCTPQTCAQICRKSPKGVRCECVKGYRTTSDGGCEDINECEQEMCSQACTNVPGSFICSCHHGYALRADRRACKALRGNMSVLYVSGNTVRSIFADYKVSVEFHDPGIASISGLDYNVRRSLLYVASASTDKLVEVNISSSDVTVTNIGKPTRVAVDWITGNIYFVDGAATSSCFRVCNVMKKRCAKLQKLPSDAQVTALAVDPASRRMFYCVTRELESVVRSASLSGRRVSDVVTVRNCTGVAVDTFRKLLYVAETGPSHILRMDYEGNNMKTFLSNNHNLQAPHGLAIFEDSIYFLGANSFKLNRCQLHGTKTCEPYLYLIFDANTFVVRHESVQRDDVVNECEDFFCTNVCTLDESGPQCVCDNGGLSTDGTCPLIDRNELPLFNGWSQQDYVRASNFSYTLVIVVLVLFAGYLCLFLYYHMVYKPAAKRAGDYMQVRYQNNSSEGITQLGLDNPIIEMPNAGGLAHEFINPLQFVKDAWQQSFPKTSRPIGTAGLVFETPKSHQDFSDTESDLDEMETKRIFGNKI